MQDGLFDAVRRMNLANGSMKNAAWTASAMRIKGPADGDARTAGLIHLKPAHKFR